MVIWKPANVCILAPVGVDVHRELRVSRDSKDFSGSGGSSGGDDACGGLLGRLPLGGPGGGEGKFARRESTSSTASES